jgi:hypothetical protein
MRWESQAGGMGGHSPGAESLHVQAVRAARGGMDMGNVFGGAAWQRVAEESSSPRGSGDLSKAVDGRGLHSFTSQLNLSRV